MFMSMLTFVLMSRLILMYLTFGLTPFCHVCQCLTQDIIGNRQQWNSSSNTPYYWTFPSPTQETISSLNDMFAGSPPWQRYLPLPMVSPSTLSPPHPTCLLSQPPAPLLVPVSTLVRLLHTTSLHIAQLPIQLWIQRILEEHIQKLHSWQQQPPPHPWQFENMFVWCLERDSNSSSQGARAEGSPFLDALASLDSKL